MMTSLLDIHESRPRRSEPADWSIMHHAAAQIVMEGFVWVTSVVKVGCFVVAVSLLACKVGWNPRCSQGLTWPSDRANLMLAHSCQGPSMIDVRVCVCVVLPSKNGGLVTMPAM